MTHLSRRAGNLHVCVHLEGCRLRFRVSARISNCSAMSWKCSSEGFSNSCPGKTGRLKDITCRRLKSAPSSLFMQGRWFATSARKAGPYWSHVIGIGSLFWGVGFQEPPSCRREVRRTTPKLPKPQALTHRKTTGFNSTVPQSHMTLLRLCSLGDEEVRKLKAWSSCPGC